jgi:hypothetical protein
MHALTKSTEVSVVASKEIGLEVNADKTKYMVMSRYLTTRQSHDVNIDNNSFERLEYFQ